jgi:sugar phosphate isomerase/epimerase
MTRREVLALAGAAPAWFRAMSPAAVAQPGKTSLGGAPGAFGARAGRAGASPFDIVEHCHRIGLGGVQTSLEATDLDSAKELRKKVEGYGLQLVLGAPQLPGEESQLFRFDNALKACKAAGAYCLHAVLTQPRYEQFDSRQAFQRDFDRTKNTIALAEPILRRNQIKLAIENYRGWRAAEQADWLKRLGSEWVGVCFNFGANLALCEDPLDTVRILAPYTLMCHVKDMAVDSYEDGFLLSEVVLGEGILDLKETVRILREKNSNMPFYLDVTTGDPLKIPVFTDKYWATFDDSNSFVPGRDLARILAIVHRNPPKKPLPRISGLDPDAAVKLEDDNNLKCIEYARQTLNI